MSECPHPSACNVVGGCRFGGDCPAGPGATPAVCPTVEAVRAKLAARAALGLRKYGVTLADAGLTRLEWLTHAQNEAMDLANYLQSLIEMEGEA